MTDLIACLSTGKGTWIEVSKLMKAEDWKNIYLIAPRFSMERFTHDRKFEFVEINPDADVDVIKSQIIEKLKGRLDMDTAINLASGSGKEHMAVISAAISLGAGIRLITVKDNKMVEA